MSASAHEDVGSVSQELKSLGVILRIIARETATPGRPTYPVPLADQISRVLKGCNGVVTRLHGLLTKYANDSVWTGAKWSLLGKEDIDRVRQTLAGHRYVLGPIFDLATLYAPCPLCVS